MATGKKKRHLPRPDLPWRAGPGYTACGRPVEGLDMVDGEDLEVLASPRGVNAVHDLRAEALAQSLCSRCGDHGVRVGFDAAPDVAVMHAIWRAEDRVEGVDQYGMVIERNVVPDPLLWELRALAALAIRHREEFERLVGEAADVYPPEKGWYYPGSSPDRYVTGLWEQYGKTVDRTPRPKRPKQRRLVGDGAVLFYALGSAIAADLEGVDVDALVRGMSQPVTGKTKLRALLYVGSMRFFAVEELTTLLRAADRMDPGTVAQVWADAEPLVRDDRSVLSGRDEIVAAMRFSYSLKDALWSSDGGGGSAAQRLNRALKPWADDPAGRQHWLAVGMFCRQELPLLETLVELASASSCRGEDPEVVASRWVNAALDAAGASVEHREAVWGHIRMFEVDDNEVDVPDLA